MTDLPAKNPDIALVPGPAVIFFIGIALAIPLLLVLPLAAEPGPKIPGFVALFAAGFLIIELSTSILLFARFREARNWSLLLLCCAYVYSGLMTIPHVMTFPGALLADRPLVDTSDQSTAWIYRLWTNGFALLSFVSVILEAWFGEHRIALHKVGRAMVIGLCSVLATCTAIVVATIAKIDSLPALIIGSHWTNLGWIVGWSVVVLLGASIAIILLVIQERSQLYLWLSLALGVMMLANVLETAGGGRFTVGWTSGRLAWLVSACVLFIYLLAVCLRYHRYRLADD